MSRISKSQNIDRLISCINTIAESRCSLSEEDLKILRNASSLLEAAKRKGKTNQDALKAIIKVVELLTSFFRNDPPDGNDE